MNQQTYRKSFVIGAVVIGVIAGVAVGFFTAHKMKGDMAGMTMGTGVVLAAPGQPGEMGTGGVSAPPGRAGEMGDMKQMDMKEKPMQGMPGMSADSRARHGRLRRTWLHSGHIENLRVGARGLCRFNWSLRTQRRPPFHPLLTGPPGHARRVSPRRENAGSTGGQSTR
ncbi:MAG: hypothetical protein E6K65_00405 [Nitrospirae bacterium]|nr:MAG: hypothetical protein E6K65_00405 [Nitrospirota bacterium]